VQQHSSNFAQLATHDSVDVIPDQTGQDQRPQYEDIQLRHTQQGPDAGHYDSLTAEIRGEQHQYDVLSRPQKKKNAPHYVDVM